MIFIIKSAIIFIKRLKGGFNIRYIAFFIISISTGFLYFLTLISSFKDNISIFLFSLLILIGIFFSMSQQLLKIRNNKKIDYRDICYVFFGGILAYIINIYFGQGAIIAASLVGILGFGFKPKYSIQLYTGAFVGMVSPDVYHDFYHIVIISLIAGFISAISNNVFEGIGGKLGAIAFSSWILLYYFSNIKLLSNPYQNSMSYELFLITFLGFSITYLLSRVLKNDVVFSSSIVSLIGALIMPEIISNYTNDYTLLLMASTFAGMSSKDKINNIYEVIMISIVLPILFIYSYSHFGGGGGKLGTIAFGSVLASNGIKNIFINIKNNAHII